MTLIQSWKEAVATGKSPIRSHVDSSEYVSSDLVLEFIFVYLEALSCFIHVWENQLQTSESTPEEHWHFVLSLSQIYYTCKLAVDWLDGEFHYKVALCLC